MSNVTAAFEDMAKERALQEEYKVRTKVSFNMPTVLVNKLDILATRLNKTRQAVVEDILVHALPDAIIGFMHGSNFTQVEAQRFIEELNSAGNLGVVDIAPGSETIGKALRDQLDIEDQIGGDQ